MEPHKIVAELPMIEVPDFLKGVRYHAMNHPGAPVEDLSGGANCHVFAYRLLQHHGLQPPWLRSRELWEDTEHTVEVTDFEPLDLLRAARVRRARDRLRG